MGTPRTISVRFIGQAAVWGSSFLLIKVALEGFSPYQLVTGRVVVAALLLYAVARRRGARLASGLRMWFTVTVSALLALVFPYWLLSVGETSVPAGTAGTLVGATPLLTLALAAILHRKRRPGIREVAGFVLGFAGLVVILRPWRSSAGPTWGLLACLVAAASYAAGYVYADHITASHAARPTRDLAPLGWAASQLIAGSGVLLVAFPILGLTPVTASPDVVAAIVGLGIGASGIATLWLFQLVVAIGPANASAVDYLVPGFAVLAGALAFREHLPLTLIAGGTIMLGGLAVAEGRLRAPGWARLSRRASAPGGRCRRTGCAVRPRTEPAGGSVPAKIEFQDQHRPCVG
jgi:drug/metabolite transporter (DMT)-like permease